MPTISVIIPIFNVESYLVQTLESLMYQTFKDIEIICVDDGSTDNSGTICERLARVDNRIHVIRQKNHGTSAARNAGMAVAAGKYISFVDGDDWLHPNFLEVLYRLCEDNECDIAQCGFAMIWPEKDITAAVFCEAAVFKGHDMALRNFLPEDGWRNIVVWNKLYRRELLANVKFPYAKGHEDEYFTYQVLYNAAYVAVTECPLYYYRQRSDSFTGNGFAVDKALDKVEAIKQKSVFYKDKDKRLFFLASLEYESTLNHYLKEVQKHVPEREDIKKLLQDKLQIAHTSLKSMDSDAVKKNGLNRFRLRNVRDTARQHFGLDCKYNRNSVFKSGIREAGAFTLQPKVSVCIPIYNVARFLANCLESVVNQTLPDVEIICVEDASTDNSREILESYAARDSRIRIICHEKNLGTQISRKEAVLAAQGKYIMFADSDDELFPNACETAVTVIEENQTDMAEFGVCALEPSGREKRLKYLITKDIDRLEARSLLHLRMQGKLKNWQIWNKIYQAALCKKAFSEIEDEYSVMAEDFRFWCIFGYYARSVSMIREELYKWKWGTGIWSGIDSGISLENYKKLLTEKDELDAVEGFINAKPDKEDYKSFLLETRRNFLHQSLSWLNDRLEENDKREGFRLFVAKWGSENAEEALQWLLLRLKQNNEAIGKKLKKLEKENGKLQQEKKELLKSKAELEKIKKSNGYKILKEYYGIRKYFTGK